MIATELKRYECNGFVMPKPITSDAENELCTSALLELESRSHLSEEEKNLAEFLAHLIETYEEKHYPIRSASPIEVLTTLMEANDLRQKDLVPIFGSESVVSEVLSGKRTFNARHIEGLSKRFNVSHGLFFKEDK
jgi:HTH-type transcriptional regulator/antitoxin HigA